MTDMQKVRAAFRWLRWAIKNGVLRSNVVKLHDGPNRALRRAGVVQVAPAPKAETEVLPSLAAFSREMGAALFPIAETPRERKNRLARERRAAKKATAA